MAFLADPLLTQSHAFMQIIQPTEKAKGFKSWINPHWSN